MEDLYNKIDALFVNGVIQGGLAMIFNIIFYMALNRFLAKLIKKQDWKYKPTIIKVKSIIIYLLLGLSIVSQLTFMKDLASTLLASGGIIAIAIGLASQEAASSMVSGVSILVSKPFQIGDTIVLREQNIRGCVKDIHLTYTIIETIEKNLIMIPNTVMNKAIIENVTEIEDFKVVYLYVDVSYESDLQKAIAIMRDVIENHPLFLDITENDEQVKVPVHCTEFKDSGIALRAKITTRSAGDGFELLSQARIQIKTLFDQNGISIPYPPVHIIQD